MAFANAHNESDFMTNLTLPTFHKKTKNFLKFYLGQHNKFMAHQDFQLTSIWTQMLDEAKTVEDIDKICNEMHDRLFITGEYQSMFDVFFNTGLRKLFGGMFGMNRDFWGELGVDDEEAYNIFHFEQIPAFQKFQVLMCWELFWGSYGQDAMRRMANYRLMQDDLYTTISMSEFTPYYTGALNLCVEETPQWFVSTVVNIFMHAFSHIKNTRKEKYINEDATINDPLWVNYRNEQLAVDPNYFQRPLLETMNVNYDTTYMEEECLPECVREVL